MGYKVWILAFITGAVFNYIIQKKRGVIVKRDPKKALVFMSISLFPVLLYFLLPNSVEVYIKTILTLLSGIVGLVVMSVCILRRKRTSA